MGTYMCASSVARPVGEYIPDAGRPEDRQSHVVKNIVQNVPRLSVWSELLESPQHCFT